MQAIVLAAGMGKRLGELTRNNTKCMVKVNGKTLVERLLEQLDSKHLERIVFVVGYEGQKLKDFISSLQVRTPIVFIDNPVYATTNNIYSLSLAKEWLCKDDTLLFESDLIFESSVVDCLLGDQRDSLALVDKYEPWMDGTCMRIGPDDEILGFVSKKNFDYNEVDGYYKTVNIYKFSKEFSSSRYVPFLEAYQGALGKNEYYEQVLNVITMLDNPGIKAKRIDGCGLWYEIDDIQDLDIAESLFAENDEERTRLFMSRYGGYWRYPRLLDYCYLVNPYFPPKRMKDEMKANFDALLTQYPSGMAVNSLLASRNFGVHEENIMVGNGAAELIKSLMESFKGRTGFIRPMFEEYWNRFDSNKAVAFVPGNADYSYNANDVMEFFSNKGIENLVLINPDNPSGNYIPKSGLLEIAKWANEKGINLVVDESFADFSDEQDNTMIDQSILDENRNLFVMKSISKSYGVPGLRLGVLASGNIEAIARMKKDVSIWNINSFAEFYMQIYQKYEGDYAVALDLFRNERKRFIEDLTSISGIRVVPSQANYIMCEIIGNMSSSKLTQRLLSKYNILIKNLSSKLGRSYIRLAIRTKEENVRLAEALRHILL